MDEEFDDALARMLAEGPPERPDLADPGWIRRRDTILAILFMCEDSFTLTATRGDGVDVYVQVKREEDHLLAEAVSNEYLRDAGVLGPRQVNTLLELGWDPPVDVQRPNFHRRAEPDADSLSRLATVLAITLRDGYGVSAGDTWAAAPADLNRIRE